MATLAQLVVKVGADTNAFTQGMAKVSKETQDFQNKMSEIGGKMQDIGKTMTAGVTAPLVAVGAAGFKMAADLQDAMGATDQIFKSSSAGMKEWADGLESYYGIAEGQALEYGNMMGSMLQNIGGLTESEAAKQSQTLIKLAGDLTAMYGGTTESAVQALTGALKGNNTMLDNYGMAVNDAMIKTKALEMGLYAGTGQMDLATKQAATLALIMEQSGAAQGQAAREAEGASGSMRALVTELKNLATSFGEVLLPVITPFIAKLNDLIKGFSGMSPQMQKTVVAVAAVAAAIGPLIMILGSLASGISAIIGIAPVLGAAFTIMTGPVGLVVAAIAALIAIGVLLVKNWDVIKAKAQEVWDFVKSHITQTWDNISAYLTEVWNNITNFAITKWDNFKTGFLGIWAAIVGGLKAYVNGIVRMVNTVIDALNTIQVEIPDWVPGIGGNSFGIDIPSVPYLAKGGIVTRPTLAVIGEDGPEAVVPLRGSRGVGGIVFNINVTGANAREIWEELGPEIERKLVLAGV